MTSSPVDSAVDSTHQLLSIRTPGPVGAQLSCVSHGLRPHENMRLGYSSLALQISCISPLSERATDGDNSAASEQADGWDGAFPWSVRWESARLSCSERVGSAEAGPGEVVLAEGPRH